MLQPVRFLVFVFLSFFFYFCFWALPSWAGPVQETLPNGLNILILENRGTSSVSVDLWVRIGSRQESPQENGISHFVEHLLFKGTASRTSQEISRQVAAVGGLFNGFTHWEYTQLHISLLPMHLDLALDILADVAQNALLTEEMIEQEKKVLLEEISLGNIYPPSYILNLVCRTLFPDNALALPISGTKETIKALRRQEILQFYRQHYVPNNMVLTIVGNENPQTALEIIRGKFISWPGGSSSPSSLLPPLQQNQFKEIRKRKFLDQAIVILALQAMGLKDSARPAFEIINAVLGSGRNSRLYQEIREKRSLSYLVGALYHPLSDTGLWAVYAGTHPKNIKQVQSIIFQELQRIQQEPIPPQELDEIKNYIRGRTLIRNENNAAMAEFISPGLHVGPGELPEEFIRKVQSVSAEEIMHVARNFLRKEGCNLIVLKPYPGLMLFRGLY